MSVYAGPEIISDSSLLFCLDAGNSKSYVGSGSTWRDLTNNSNNLTLTNSPSFSGGIFTFTPASSHYAISSNNLTSLSNWTVESWFKVNSSLTGQVTSVITNEYNGSVLNFSMGTNQAPTNYNICVGFFNGAWRNATGFAPVIGNWYHMAGTYNGTVLNEYVNGAVNSTLNYTGTSTSGGLIRVARRWDDVVSSANLFPGSIAYIKIYNRALDSNEIIQNYIANKTRFGL